MAARAAVRTCRRVGQGSWRNIPLPYFSKQGCTAELAALRLGCRIVDVSTVGELCRRWFPKVQRCLPLLLLPWPPLPLLLLPAAEVPAQRPMLPGLPLPTLPRSTCGGPRRRTPTQPCRVSRWWVPWEGQRGLRQGAHHGPPAPTMARQSMPRCSHALPQTCGSPLRSSSTSGGPYSKSGRACSEWALWGAGPSCSPRPPSCERRMLQAL